MPTPRPDPALLASLRERIRRIEGGDRTPGDVLPLGLEAVDAALPGGGLPRAVLHEVAAAGRPGDRAATGFASVLLAALAGRDGTVLWCRPGGDLHAPGLRTFGLDPARLVVVRSRRDADLLWAMEEGLRSGVPAAVLGELGSVSMVAARRLQLAAEAGRVTALLLRPAGPAQASPAVTRWRVATAPSLTDLPGLGPARWNLHLVRSRHGGRGHWLVEWVDDGQTRGLRLAADPAHRPAVPAVDGGGTAAWRDPGQRLVG